MSRTATMTPLRSFINEYCETANIVDLSERLGVSKSYISMVLLGHRNLTDAAVDKWADLLGITDAKLKDKFRKAVEATGTQQIRLRMEYLTVSQRQALNALAKQINQKESEITDKEFKTVLKSSFNEFLSARR